MEHVVFDPRLTQPDLLVLQNLAADISQHVSQNNSKPDGQKLNGRKPSAKELGMKASNWRFRAEASNIFSLILPHRCER